MVMIELLSSHHGVLRVWEVLISDHNTPPSLGEDIMMSLVVGHAHFMGCGVEGRGGEGQAYWTGAVFMTSPPSPSHSFLVVMVVWPVSSDRQQCDPPSHPP